jgi:peptidase S58-like protein
MRQPVIDNTWVIGGGDGGRSGSRKNTRLRHSARLTAPIPFEGKRIGDDRHRYRCARGRTEREANGSEGDAGAGRTGAAGSNGSGDYAIAFSTEQQVRIRSSEKASTRHVELLTNDAMSPLFMAVIEATEEAVYNSLFRATTITGREHTVEALTSSRSGKTPPRHSHLQTRESRVREAAIAPLVLGQVLGCKLPPVVRARLEVHGYD